MGGKVLVWWSQIQEQCHVSQTTSAEKKICKGPLYQSNAVDSESPDPF